MKVDILSIDQVFKQNLIIPSYQRPYKWTKRNVVQLLEDIERNKKQNLVASYRIGTLILHDENGDQSTLCVVDGQQRLVTLSIILYILNSNLNLSLLDCIFSHEESRRSIRTNYAVIREWIEKWNDSRKEAFEKYILLRCDFVVIGTKDISEAFQFFDSQNARGKFLEPYDLLKAFHLREMASNSEVEKTACVDYWEDAVNDNSLDNLGRYLYRIRKWAKNEKAYEFTINDISEFKGVNIDQYKDYPYLKQNVLVDKMLDRYNSDQVLKTLTNIPYPFQINGLIINGKRFFEYIQYYSSLYSDFKGLSEFGKFYNMHCKYSRSDRSGDTYVREVYKALCLFYIDRFGVLEFDRSTYVSLYKWSYTLRLVLKTVYYSSIDKYVINQNDRVELKNIFYEINQMFYPSNLEKKASVRVIGDYRFEVEEIESVLKNE